MTLSKKAEGPIRQAWKQFWEAVFEPWTAILLVSTLFLFAFSQARLTAASNSLLQVLLAVSSGVLGGRVANRISAIAGEGILIARGKVSVRSLKLLYQYATSLESRVARFLADKSIIRTNAEATERGLEEVIAGCRHVQEHALSSIDNWTDVVPGAGEIVASIGVASAANAEVASAEEKVATLQEELEAMRADQRAQAAERDQALERIQEELEAAKKELTDWRASARTANSRLVLDQLGLPGVGLPTITYRIAGSKKDNKETLKKRILDLQASINRYQKALSNLELADAASANDVDEDGKKVRDGDGG